MASRYSAAHESPNGPGDSRPTALQIIRDEGVENALAGKVILITGCSSGLGVDTARALYETGATLYLMARDTKKATSALSDIIHSPRVNVLHLDLSSLSSARACAEEFISKSQSLNILIENAGVMACPEGKTEDGFETQFGSNYLAHFLLFYKLTPLLLDSSTPDFASRVVIVASSAHRISPVHFDNISLSGEYDPWKSYSQSKTALVWAANEIERRYGSQGLHAFSLHPGGIQTELLRHVTDEQKAAWAGNDVLSKYWKSPEQGAATTVCGQQWQRSWKVRAESIWITVKLLVRMIQAKEILHQDRLHGLMIGMVRQGCGLLRWKCCTWKLNESATLKRLFAEY